MTPQELQRLFELHADRLVLIARSLGEPAEDAVQEAFIALASQKSLPDDVFAWLVRVARNRLIQWQRQAKKRRDLLREHSVQQDWFDGEVVWIDRRLDAKEVTQALCEIEPTTREVIVMHLWGEMTFDQIAETTGLSRSSAHRAYQQGIERLRSAFSSTDSTQPETSPLEQPS